MTNNQNFKVPEGWVLIPDASNMTDEQAEFLATEVNVCGGIAYDLYRKLLEVSPKFQENKLEDCDEEGWSHVPKYWNKLHCPISTFGKDVLLEVAYRDGKTAIGSSDTWSIDWVQQEDVFDIIKFRVVKP